MKLSLLSALLVLTLAAPDAYATSNFPMDIQTDLALKSAPACALCHTTGNAGGRSVGK